MSGPSSFAQSYCAFLKRARHVIFLLWFAVGILGLIWGRNFTGATTSQYTSAHDSDSAEAARKNAAHFPSSANSQSVTILLQQKSAAPTTANFLEQIQPVENDLYTACQEKYGYDVTAPCPDCFFRSMQSYWRKCCGLTLATFICIFDSLTPRCAAVLRNAFGADEMANQFVADGASSATGKWATTISISYDNSDPAKIDKMVNWLETQVDDLIRKHSLQGDVERGSCGLAPFATAILDGVHEDLEFMDTAVLPLALLILGTIIQSATLMLIPILNILITILAEFLVMYPIALQMDVVSFTPSLMMSITIAMSIDYSLFLLSRFREELAAGRSVEEAIPFMIDGAGHTILVSGGTLICCFLGMLIFPMDMLRSVGIGASVTLFFALSVNLTLTPSILYSIGEHLVAQQDYLVTSARRLLGCQERAGNRETRLSFVDATANPMEGASNLSASLLDDGGDNIAAGKAGDGDCERIPRAVESIGAADGEAVRQEEEEEEEEEEEAEEWTKLGEIHDHEGGGEEGALGGASKHDMVASMNFSAFANSISYSNTSLSTSPDRACDNDIGLSESVWYNLAWQLLNPWRGAIIVLVVVALSAPICRWCLSVDISISFDMSVPEGSDTYNTFNDIKRSFGGGSVFPYTLLFVPESGASICDPEEYGSGLWCPQGFEYINDALTQITSNGDKHSTVSFMLGITRLGSYGPVDFGDYAAAFQADDKTSYDESLGLLYTGFCQHASSSAVSCDAAQVTIALSSDPYSKEGVKWLQSARRTIRDLPKDSHFPISMFLGQGASATYDVTQAVYDSFPLIIIVTLSTVFVLMGVSFKSIVAPIRSVATLSLTLAFVFGFLVLVYQEGAFDFLGLRCLQNTHGVSWLPPVMCFSIIVGLGLDYDVFLISRIYEFRLGGYTDHAAAVKGICATGYIITAAGMIMAVAFGGLFTSQELILNQAAFLLVFAVLLDTFIVRTICVPALLGITNTLSWWPQRLPPPTKSIMY